MRRARRACRLVVHRRGAGACAAGAGGRGRGGASHRPGRLPGAAPGQPGPHHVVSAQPRPGAYRDRKPQRGVEELLQVGQTARLVPFDNPSDYPWRSWAAEGLRRLDRNDEARALAGEELALARRWGDPRAIGASLRMLGLVEGDEAGIGLLREAVEALASSQARLEHARSLVDLDAAPREPAHRGRPAAPGRRRPRAKGRRVRARRAGPTRRSPPPVPGHGRSSTPGSTHSPRANGAWHSSPPTG